MTLQRYVNQAGKVILANSPAILSALGITGTIATAYLSHQAGVKTTNDMQKHDLYSRPWKEKFQFLWKNYIPPVIAGAVTITCVITGTRAGLKKTAAAYSLLSVSEKAFDEYKEKLSEQIGPKKEKAIRDAIAQDRVNNNQAMIVSGSGNVLCYEMHTGRYFNSDVDALKKAQNEINAQMFRENDANLNDFYYMVGLPQTSYSSGTGWTSDKLLELSFSAVMAEDGRPCIAFEYNYVKPL